MDYVNYKDVLTLVHKEVHNTTLASGVYQAVNDILYRLSVLPEAPATRKRPPPTDYSDDDDFDFS